MNTRTAGTALMLALAISLIGAGNLTAQRRRSDGGGSGTERRAPSGATRGSGGTGRSPAAAPRRGGSGESRGSARAAEPRSSGKIGAIRDQAGRARIPTSRGVIVVSGVWIGSCWDCDYWGWHHGYWGWYHRGWWYPAHYPRYHRPHDDEGYDRPPARRFGAVSGQFFDDRGSTTQAGRFALEGGIGVFRGAAAYDQYAERVRGGVDRLHTFRISAGVEPRLGPGASLVAGVGVRGVVLSDGETASGPEGELGLRVSPVRPIGVNVTGRLAELSWSGVDRFTFREVTTTGSVFLGRVELQAGWHWMRMGNTPAFGGPVIGTRLWF